MEPQVSSFSDAVQELEEFCREASLSVAGRGIRSAIRRAYREVVDSYDWSSLRANGRVMLQAPQTTGTVTYDQVGGVFNRLLTLSGATWPTAAQDWSVEIETDDGDILCDIDTRLTSTQVTLDAVLNPGEDVAAGASYVAYPRYYRLPMDFRSMDRPVEEALAALGTYVTLERMLELKEQGRGSGDVQFFTIAAVPDLYGAQGLFVEPYADTTRPIDFVYKRIPRELRYVGTDASDCPGTITTVADSADVTGSSTAFAAAHIGSLLRFGSSTSQLPTGLDGLRPYAEQRSIISRSSATAITLDAAVTGSYSAVKYAISDPIDLDPNAFDAMMTLARKHLAVEKGHKNAAAIAALAEQRLFDAKSGDNRAYTRIACGLPGRRTNVVSSSTVVDGELL